MHNFEIAWAFRELATLLEVKGENSFKVVAYRKGAEVLEGMDRPVAAMSQEEILSVPGLGKALVANILELETTGRLEVLQHLRKEIPKGVVQALALPGVGTKVAHKLMTHLKIKTLQDLKEAAQAKRIRTIPGLGPKVEVNIQRGIARLEEQAGLILLAEARGVAGRLVDFLYKLPVRRAEVAGEVRRGEEMVEQLELVVDPGVTDWKEMAEVLGKHPLLVGDMLSQEVEGQWVLLAQLRSGIKLIVYVLGEAEFIPAWLYHTGNAGHWGRLVELAEKKGLSLGPRHFTGNGFEPADGDDHCEAAVYSALGLPYIAPELRDNQGEIEAGLKGQLPGLIRQVDLKGDLHLHSKWSDGVNTIEELVEAARKRGYEYIAITDHSRSLAIARGLPIEKLKEQKQRIAGLNQTLQGFRVFAGIEMDILGDGRLDYPDEILEELDLVIGSIHSGFRQEGEKLTNRILGAIQNPHVDIVAHPTGRVLGRRDPYGVDIRAILEAAAKYDTVLEINSSPDRLDLKAEYCRQAKESGVKLAINTDAHEAGAMADAELGIIIARKGWLEAKDVINTMSAKELEEYLRNKL